MPIALVISAFAPAGPGRADSIAAGEGIYRRQCAACHGAEGQGNEEYHPQPLTGDRSLKELARYISESMPEDDPEKCSGEDAENVAAYIYETFYSEIAQARRAPARIDLARLTAPQHESAVSDLLASFVTDSPIPGATQAGATDRPHGLRGEYFRGRDFRDDRRAIDRTDSVIDLNFGEALPDWMTEGDRAESEQPKESAAEKKEPPGEFALRWNGSILAPDTGTYDFVVVTDNAARLWINDMSTPLIDAWVKSGDEREYRGSLRLLGGRYYPIRCEFLKTREPSASIRLMWQPPLHAAETVAQRYLAPQSFPTRFVPATPFPADDRSLGYDRGTAISRQWDEATTYAALEVAAYVADRLNLLAGTADGAEDRQARLRLFCGEFARRAFRRPLSDEQREFFIERPFQEAASDEDAVKRTVVLVLKSPRFLYHDARIGEFDAFDTAEWLSLALWDSLPDEPLYAAAAEGRLETHEKILEQTMRMMPDPRTRFKVRKFFHQWLGVDPPRSFEKDALHHPDFDASIVADLRRSLDLFLEDVFWSGGSDFRQLLLDEALFLNGRLAAFYGVQHTESPTFEDQAFQRVTVSTQDRAGILSHPYLMAGFAYRSSTSPIHRGVFIARNLLGRRLKPPPDAVTPLPPELHEDLTTRERVTLQTGPATCQSCHAMINPLGFPLEQFDAVGRYRTLEKSRDIDVSGFYITRSGEHAEFSGPRQLALFLAHHPETQRAFIERLFQHTIKQPIRAFGDDRLDVLHAALVRDNFNMRELLAEIVVSSAIAAGEQAHVESSEP